jgi:putative endonuclease
VTESVKPQPGLKKRILSQKQNKLSKNKLGKFGEEWVGKWLQKKGWSVLASNIRFKQAEIDLIAFDPKWKEIVFVEVKTRSSKKYGSPSQAVGSKKITAMQLVAAEYIKRYNYKHDYRFDIVSVVTRLGDSKGDGLLSGRQPQVEHFENVTWL